MSDEEGTRRVYECTCNGARIYRLQALEWPDGYCTTGFMTSFPDGRFAMAPTLAEACEFAETLASRCEVQP